MSRAKGLSTVVNFAGGKNTEASKINPAPNTAEILDNVDLLINGSVRRRPGMDFERESTYTEDIGPGSIFSGSTPGIDLGPTARSVHVWDNVDLDARISFVLVRYGNRLFIFNSAAVSTTQSLLTELDISPFNTDSTQSPGSVITSSHGQGAIFFTGEHLNPFVITHDRFTGVFTMALIDVQIRDFDGVDDTLNVDERPTTLSKEHLYNLLNQGWTRERINTFSGTSSIVTTDLNYDVEYTSNTGRVLGSIENEQNGRVGFELSGDTTSSTSYPSNADIMFLGMKANSSGDLVFSRDELINQTFGNTPASKGHYILSAFSKNRGTVSGTGVPNSPEDLRLMGSAFYSGRVFYCGLDTKVHFSQTLTDISKVGKCYQEQDPTAEDFNDLLDTDGGVISIPEAGRIHSVFAIETGVVVFSRNGVWFVSGGENNFSATSAQVEQVSNLGAISNSSIVSVEGTLMYWSDNGIMRLSSDEISGRLTAVNMTTLSIQEEFNAIGRTAKQYATGHYDKEDKIVTWLYRNSETISGIATNFSFDKALKFNIALNAFYNHTFEDLPGGFGFTTLTPMIFGQFSKRPSIVADSTQNVTENGVIVTADAVDVTVEVELETISDNLKLKLATIAFENDSGHYFLRFAEYNAITFRNWDSVENGFSGNLGGEFSSTIETSSENFGTLAADKHDTYVLPYFQNTLRQTTSGISGSTATSYLRTQTFPNDTYIICMVLDTSGSMGGSRINGMVATAKEIIALHVEHARLTSNYFGLKIIPFGSAVKEVFERPLEFVPDPAPNVINAMWSFDIPTVNDYLDSLTAVGFTNWEEPYGDAEQFFLDAGNVGQENICYFLTDGKPNTIVGGTPGGSTNQAATDAALAAGADMFDQSTGTLTGSTAVNVHAINIGATDVTFTTQIDNTPGDSPAVPVSVSPHSDLYDIMIGYTPNIDTNLESSVLNNPSACQVQGKWEWTTADGYGRWSTPQQGYRLEKSFVNPSPLTEDQLAKEVVNTKLKIRGKGKSLRLNFESEDTKDFHLLGYAIPFTAAADA